MNNMHFINVLLTDIFNISHLNMLFSILYSHTVSSPVINFFYSLIKL